MSKGGYFLFNSKSWKTRCQLEIVDSEEDTLGWTSEAFKRAFDQYQYDLNHPMKFMIPEEWKGFTEDTDALSSLICRSLKTYFDYLSDLYERLPLKPFISYVEASEIEKLKFPNPQITPDDHVDPLKYYTSVSRALLHMFSYPGLTICRCEMDAERNTSLLLSSFFDWFAVLQPGTSTSEAIDSIRVFKRNSYPEWTRDGFVPIVFFLQRLQSTSEQRNVAEVLQYIREGPLPDILIPLIAAVEETLRKLLVHAITSWKEKRTTDDCFVLPDWLFIHGLVYDALGIILYTFFLKIIECNSAGEPSKWEFICIPTNPIQLNLFQPRSVIRRRENVTILLAIQRHTKRIGRILDSLKLPTSTVVAPVVPEWSEETKYDEKIEYDEILKCEDSNGANLHSSEAVEAATQCLLKCIHRAGLDPGCCGDSSCTSSVEWSYLNRPFDIPLASGTLAPSKSFIVDFMDNWQTLGSKKLSLPEDWFTTIYDLSGPSNMLPRELFQILPRALLRMWTSRWKESFASLTTEEMQKRHFDSRSFSPDFFLSTPPHIDRGADFHGIPPLEGFYPDTIHCLEHFKDVYQYTSYESDAKMAVSSPLMCTPGCWLKYDTQSRFPPALTIDSTSVNVDFSLLLHPIQTVPIIMTPLAPDVRLRATILNPALIVAIQGPAAWPGEFACSPALSTSKSRPKNKSEALRRLAKAIEPSLKTHLINWQLRFEQGLVSSRELPPWFMLFGLIYDAEEVTIVAHIPYMTNSDPFQYSFISCIVDIISFPVVNESSKITDPWFLDRFRVGLALLSLQKHAFHMAELWECVVWPDELVSWEEIIEREYLGPVLTPLERGYMVEPGPMTQLYRDMHGSDETIIDHSGDVSDYEEDADMEDGSGDYDEDEDEGDD